MFPLTTLIRHRAFVIVIAFAAVLFLSDIWTYKEFVRAESYFALGARLMVERGEWLAPHAPDEVQLNKPPLTYWLIGASYELFGPSYGSSRLPSVASALLVLVIVYAVGFRLHGARTGVMSAAMLASSYLFLSFARMAMSDMLLTLFVTASFAALMLALSEETVRSRQLAIAGYIPLALGILTKGPVALVLVAAPIFIAAVLLRDPATVRRLRLLPGLILLALTTVPYFLLVYMRLGSGPLRFFFLGENLQRFTGAVYGNSARSFWYQLAAFFSDFAPWSLLLFAAAWFDWRVRSRDESKDIARMLLYLWLGFTILLFSVSSFKLDYYLLPAMPAGALIVGPIIANAENSSGFTRRFVQIFLVLCALAITAVAILSLRAAELLSVQTSFRFAPLAVAVIGLIVMSFSFRERRLWHPTIVLMATMAATILMLQLALLSAFARYLPATRLVAEAPPDRIWYTSWLAADWANCLAFNLSPPHQVERLVGDANNERLLAALKNDPRVLAVIREREYAALVAQDPTLKILAEAETYGHGGLNLKMLRHPSRERLFVVGHER